MNIQNFILEDTTLRDGEQAPGVSYDLRKKLEIFSALVESGIKWIEVGIPAMGGQELDFIKNVKQLDITNDRDEPLNLVVWNRGILDDVKQSIDLGYHHIHIGLPTSNIHLENSINKSRSWLLSQATTLVKYAKDRGCFVSISAEDVGRTELNFLQEYAAVVAEAGADRLRLSDTVGILNPDKYSKIILAVKTVTNVDLQCHAHNDFGLAVANTLAGLKSGARYFHVTVNGIGERAGMPDLSQTVLALKFFYDVDVGIKLDKLKKLSQIVAERSNTKIYPWQPIVGDNVFSHESGIHANGSIRCGESFEPFPPELVGADRKIIIGKHSGRASINYILNSAGVKDIDQDALKICLEQIREKSMEFGRALDIAETLETYYESISVLA